MPADLTAFNEPLAEGPSVLRAIIARRSDEWLDRKHAEDVVSPREAVAHLVLCEGYWSWIDRLKALHDENYRPGSEDEMSEEQLLHDFTLDELLGKFEELRAANLSALSDLAMTEEYLDRPDSEREATARELMNVWVAHDLYHFGQIFKSYASAYVGRIGLYQGYLNLPHFN